MDETDAGGHFFLTVQVWFPNKKWKEMCTTCYGAWAFPAIGSWHSHIVKKFRTIQKLSFVINLCNILYKKIYICPLSLNLKWPNQSDAVVSTPANSDWWIEAEYIHLKIMNFTRTVNASSPDPQPEATVWEDNNQNSQTHLKNTKSTLVAHAHKTA